MREQIQTTLNNHKGWYRHPEAMGDGETNYRALAMFIDLRSLMPTDPALQADWYAACAIEFGLVAMSPPKPKRKQLTLF